MKLLIGFLFVLFSLQAHAGFQAFDHTKDLKIAQGLRCDGDLVCSMTKGAVLNVSMTASGGGGGVLETITVTTTQNLTSDACGKMVILKGSANAILPAAASNIGCQVTVVAQGDNGTDRSLRPLSGETLVKITSAANHRYHTDEEGNTVTMIAVATGQWMAQSSYGDGWADGAP